MSYSEIGKELCIPRSMVSSFLTQSKQRDYVTNLPRPGRPPAISESQERYIIQTVNTNTRIPFTELCNITNTNVSIRTIQRHLQNHNLQKWRAAKHTLLTQEHAKKCLKWAMAHGHWKVEDWKRVFWSDECAVKKDSDPQTLWIFRSQNKRKKYDPKNIHGQSKSGGIQQMVWGCFPGSKLGPIVFIDGTVNSDKYIELLRENLLPFIDAM